jgi:hypothetical protein
MAFDEEHDPLDECLLQCSKMQKDVERLNWLIANPAQAARLFESFDMDGEAGAEEFRSAVDRAAK